MSRSGKGVAGRAAATLIFMAESIWAKEIAIIAVSYPVLLPADLLQDFPLSYVCNIISLLCDLRCI